MRSRLGYGVSGFRAATASGRCWQILAALSLLPALFFLLRWREVPQFGLLLDDGVYFSSAQSIASTGEYRLASFPDAPAATKYPPLYPAWLALAWRIDPAFPGNLSWAAALTWIWLPVLIALLWLYLRGAGFSARAAGAACVLTATNPFMAFFSANLMSELPFLAGLLGTLVLIQRGYFAAAGLAAGAAFLTRSTGIVLLGAVPLWLLLDRRGWRPVARFAGAMLPAVIGWTAWSAAHPPPGRDLVTLFYTSYSAFYRLTLESVGLVDLAGANLPVGLMSLGRLVLLQFADGLAGLGLAAWTGLLGCFALARLVARPELRLGGLVCLAIGAMHLIWNFTPNERMLLPLTPFLWAGVGSFACDPKVRPQLATGIKLALVALLAAYQSVEGIGGYMNALLSGEVPAAQKRAAVMKWMGANLPPDARVAAVRDAELYLRTGRQALWSHTPPWHSYRRDTEAVWRGATSAGQAAADRGIRYFLEDPANFSFDLSPDRRAELRRLHGADPTWRPLHRDGGFAVYEIGSPR